jgi:hypothetical protein
MSMLKGEPTQRTKKRRGHRGEVAATGIVDTDKEASIINNIGTQRGDCEEDDNHGVESCTSTLRSQPPTTPTNEELAGVTPVTSELGPAASPVLPCYSVGEGISLPFGQSLPQCSDCSNNALIAWSSRSDPKQTGVVCLYHGTSNIRNLALMWDVQRRYRFISREHEAALRAFLA